MNLKHLNKIALKITLTLTTFLVVTNVQASALSSKGEAVKSNNITLEEVHKAQENWGKGLVQISEDFDKSGIKKAKQTAEKILDTAYGYSQGPVLFKPTLASGEQTFRTTKESALAYFVGQNTQFPKDTGFALKGWRKMEYVNAAVYINGNMAMTMGNVILTDKSGKQTKVDKTWAFKKGDDGQLRIVLHHSSLPYENVTVAEK